MSNHLTRHLAFILAFLMAGFLACDPPNLTPCAPNCAPEPQPPQWETLAISGAVNGLAGFENDTWATAPGGSPWKIDSAGVILRMDQSEGWPGKTGCTGAILALEDDLFLGTDAGLVSYSSGNFAVEFPFGSDSSKNIITALASSPSLGLLVGNSLGKIAYRQLGSWQVLIPETGGIQPQSITDLGVSNLSPEILLAGSSANGNWLRIQGNWNQYPLSTPVQDIHFTVWGGVEFWWVATEGEGLIQADLGGERRFLRSDGLLSNQLFALTEDNQNRLWVGTNEGLNILSQYEAPGNAYTPFLDQITQSDGLPDRRIRALYFDSDGILWVGSLSGLARLVP